MTDWYRRWFGQDYLDLYPHRNEDDAARLVSMIGSRIPLQSQHLLDLACGPGRHGKQLIGQGASVTGIDLSDTLIRIAAGVPGLNPVRGDMRFLPFRVSSFDVVVNLFTSFGYFDDDSHDLMVLREVYRVLKPGGRFVLDFLNPTYTVANLVPNESSTMGVEEVEVTREIIQDGRFVQKTINRVRDGASFKERVRLFSEEELTAMFDTAGLSVTATAGAYDDSPISATSPRMILFASKD